MKMPVSYHKISQLRLWRYFQMLGRPILRHGVFMIFITLLLGLTYHIVGEPRTRHPEFYALQFLTDLYIFCAILCILPRRLMVGLKYAAYTVSYLLCITEAFLHKRFYLAFSPTMINLVLETDGREASEFLTSAVQSPHFTTIVELYGLLLLANIIAGRWGYLCYTQAWRWLRKRLRKGYGVRRRTARFLQNLVFPTAALLLLITTLPPWTAEKRKMMEFLQLEESMQAEEISGNVFYSPVYRIVWALKFALIAQNDIKRLIERMSLITDGEYDGEYDGKPASGNTLHEQQGKKAQVSKNTPADIVLIIGESYNKHHASCYGNALQTTPHTDSLCRRGEMTLFHDAVTPFNVTASAFKHMLSTHSADAPGTWTDGVLFPAILKAEGWRVAFITNQFTPSKRQNRSDFNGSFFLNNPQLDSLCFDYRNRRRYRYDGGITAETQRITPAAHNFYIFHLMGQHVMYNERYPKSHAIFNETDIQRTDLSPQERTIVADYANATRYNDAVVAKIIRQFQQRDAIVVYLADHGDEVFDGTTRMYGRNHSSTLTPDILRYEYEIPLMIWTSRAFRRHHPDVVQRIADAARRPFASDDLSHLILGLAETQSSYYSPQRDILSPSFVPHKRIVKNTAFYEDIMQSK